MIFFIGVILTAGGDRIGVNMTLLNGQVRILLKLSPIHMTATG